jgi:hypothetical protein
MTEELSARLPTGCLLMLLSYADAKNEARRHLWPPPTNNAVTDGNRALFAHNPIADNVLSDDVDEVDFGHYSIPCDNTILDDNA